MLDCVNLVGIRECESSLIPPLSGLYFEDLPGITLKKVAMSAEGGTGKELIQKSLDEALIKLNSDILYFVQKHASTYAKGLNSLDKKAKYEGYFKNQFVEGGTVESLDVNVRNYQNNWGFSKVRLGNLFVNPDIEILDFTIDIIDIDPADNQTTRTRTYNLGTAKANFKNVLSILEIDGTPVTVNGENFRIETANLDTVNAQRILYLADCSTCRGYKPQNNQFFRFTGNQSFFLELYSICERDDMLCFLYNEPLYIEQLGELQRLKAGIWYLTNLLHSDRENFATQNMDIMNINTQLNAFTLEYEELKVMYLPDIVRSVMQKDKICYTCFGAKQKQAIF